MTLVLCHCVHRRLLDATRLAWVRTAVLAQGGRVVDAADLCAAAAHGDSVLAAALATADSLLCGCHVRALQALARRVLGHAATQVRAIDLRDADDAAILAALGRSTVPEASATAATPAAADDAWYPLIDAERCTDCASCQSFCLFGVYARRENGSVCVQAPLKCKTDCPACARVCPANAIIFPKSTDSAINGAARTAEQLRGARIRLNPQDVLGGDLRAKLAARRAAAPPLFRPGVFAPPPEDPGDGQNAGGQGR
jgi:NAD-dependent dihydropyrimidine dehydrogenase PreA subunit